MSRTQGATGRARRRRLPWFAGATLIGIAGGATAYFLVPASEHEEPFEPPGPSGTLPDEPITPSWTTVGPPAAAPEALPEMTPATEDTFAAVGDLWALEVMRFTQDEDGDDLTDDGSPEKYVLALADPDGNLFEVMELSGSWRIVSWDAGRGYAWMSSWSTSARVTSYHVVDLEGRAITDIRPPTFKQMEYVATPSDGMPRWLLTSEGSAEYGTWDPEWGWIVTSEATGYPSEYLSFYRGGYRGDWVFYTLSMGDLLIDGTVEAWFTANNLVTGASVTVDPPAGFYHCNLAYPTIPGALYAWCRSTETEAAEVIELRAPDFVGEVLDNALLPYDEISYGEGRLRDLQCPGTPLIVIRGHDRWDFSEVGVLTDSGLRELADIPPQANTWWVSFTGSCMGLREPRLGTYVVGSENPETPSDDLAVDVVSGRFVFVTLPETVEGWMVEIISSLINVEPDDTNTATE